MSEIVPMVLTHFRNQDIPKSLDQSIVFICPTAAIPSHPSSAIIEEVVASVRVFFPTAPFYLCFDGIAEYLRVIPGRATAYAQYYKKCEELCESGVWTNVHLRRFEKRTQQAEMTRQVLNEITQPYFFFIEHDTPLRTEREFHWATMRSVLDDGDANMIRLSYWEEGVHEAHQHLTRGSFYRDGVEFVRTEQYSQWPNMSTCAFYRKMLADKIPPGTETMIEIYLYGPCAADPEYFNVVVYCPGEPNQRFHHRNGRNGDPCDWS